MRLPVELHGRPASSGIWVGPVIVLDEAPRQARMAGGPAEEAMALETAITAAVGEIVDLIARTEGAGADILEFQVAMLEDEALKAPALAEIADGLSADAAWRHAVDAEAAAYRDAEDEYFRARAADLEDMRDRVLRLLTGEGRETAVAPGSVVVGRDLTPSAFLAVDWEKGGAIALAEGSPASHVAMLARSRGVPMVVSLGPGVMNARGRAVVDAEGGVVVLDPDEAALASVAAETASIEARRASEAAFASTRAATSDGVPIAVMINVADPAELDRIDPATCDGIGLVRTELLFHREAGLPDEERQYRTYRRIVEWAAGRPVTIRTLDAGGDKPIAGLTVEEQNPFLGLRGIRLSLARPEVFRVQLRALARAAVHGQLKVMLPMVTVPDEVEQARALLHDALADLDRDGVPARRPPLGIMVEVPAVALAPNRFAVDFLSIGSNDLTQYVTAAARDLASVATLADPGNPALLRLIREVAAHGKEAGIDVSLCGDMGGDPARVPALIRAGLTSLSVAPSAVGRVKAAIAAARAMGPEAR